MALPRIVAIVNGIKAMLVPVASSTGAAQASSLVATNGNGLVDPTLMPAFTGDATSIAGASGLTLAASGVTAGSFGSTTVTAGTAPSMPSFTVDAKGRVTAAATVALGTAASYPVGTSGAAIPLLNTNNTWSQPQAWSGIVQFNAQLIWPTTTQTAVSVSVASTTQPFILMLPTAAATLTFTCMSYLNNTGWIVMNGSQFAITVNIGNSKTITGVNPSGGSGLAGVATCTIPAYGSLRVMYQSGQLYSY